MIDRDRSIFGNPLQKITNEAELYFQALATQPEFETAMNDFLDHLREQNPGKFEGVEFKCAKPKKPERYKAKVDGDYGGAAEQTLDIVRGTFVCENDDEIFELQDALVEEFEVLRAKDRFYTPTDAGFRNFHNNLEMPNGHIVEVQVMFLGTWLDKDRTHDLMEEIQEIKRKKLADQTIDDVIRKNSLVKAARLLNNSAVASMKTENLINPAWTSGQVEKFTIIESHDPLFRKLFGDQMIADNENSDLANKHDNENSAPSSEADKNEPAA